MNFRLCSDIAFATDRSSTLGCNIALKYFDMVRYLLCLMLSVLSTLAGVVTATCAAENPTSLKLAKNSQPAAENMFPSKPIRLIVPFPAGGGGDGAARPLAQALSSRLDQRVVIDNRGGAGGIIGMEIAATAAPNGYTLLLSTVGLTAMPALYKKLTFDPVKDFTGVIVAESGIYILVVNPSSSLKSVKELIAYRHWYHYSPSWRIIQKHCAGQYGSRAIPRCRPSTYRRHRRTSADHVCFGTQRTSDD